MNFTLRILGTASAMPVSGRFQSAHVLEVHGRLFLIDCGEGVQQQMLRYGVSMMKLDSIFISHIHGDHIFGLMPLLSTMGMKGRTVPLNIYAPANFGPLLKFFLSYYGDGLAFEIHFTPLSCTEPQVVYKTKNIEVLAFPLNHKIADFGFIFREKMPLMNIREGAIDRFGLTRTEIGTLKRGEDVLRPADGDSGQDGFYVIKNAEAAYRPYIPRSYAYVSDTAPFPQLAEWVRGVSLLYHETTYLTELSDQAASRHHSTTVQAAECALRAGAGKLVVGHYSARCKDEKLYEAECRSIFPESYAAMDGDVFPIPLERLG